MANDAANLRARRERIAKQWKMERGAVLVASGLPIPIAGTDQYHPFYAHNEYAYLGGVAKPGSVLVFDPEEGWTLFAHVAGAEERVWEGETDDLEEVAHVTGVERVRPVDRLGEWLEKRRGEGLAILGNRDILEHSDVYGLEAWWRLEAEVDEEASGRLSEVVSETRRAKDAGELDLMRKAAAASVRGHLAGFRLARAGMSERDLQVEIEVEFFRRGASRTAYGTIVGTGKHGATLHFMPTGKRLADGDIVLVDAGAEIGGYASDVTRTFPVSGRFSAEQRALYEVVLGVQREAIAGVGPGVEYKDLHLRAARGIAEGLADFGLLKGAPDDLVEMDAHALFFPHGLGHMLGLATHDAGGCLAGRERSERPGLRYLRADLPVQPGYVVTIEPGIYFIDALLDDPESREKYRQAVDWERVDRMREFGGIRIEDDVLVTEAGADVLSGALPKSVEEIEALRMEGLAG
ncbi:MAG: aminopeptidase P N-terminal domain-containing protein [Tepidiformaceae bacterium]